VAINYHYTDLRGLANCATQAINASKRYGKTNYTILATNFCYRQYKKDNDAKAESKPQVYHSNLVDSKKLVVMADFLQTIF